MKEKEKVKDITRQKRSEKAKEVERKQGGYSPKLLGDSPSEPLSRLKFQQAIPWKRPTRQSN